MSIYGRMTEGHFKQLYILNAHLGKPRGNILGGINTLLKRSDVYVGHRAIGNEPGQVFFGSRHQFGDSGAFCGCFHVPPCSDETVTCLLVTYFFLDFGFYNFRVGTSRLGLPVWLSEEVKQCGDH